MNNAPGRKLSDHESVSGTTVHGWSSVAFGLIFAGAGTAVAVLVLSDGSIGDPKRFLALVCCGIFAAGGLTLVTHGLAGVRRTTRVRRGRKVYPHEPWRWDHRWNEKGIKDDAVKRLLLWAYRTLFIAVFVFPFNWLVFLSGELPWWGLVGFGGGTILADLLVVYVTYRFVKSLVQLVRYGRGAIRYARFPFFPGETLDVSFVPTGRMADVRELRATLRCVDECYEVFNPDDSDSSATVVCYELYSDTKTIAGNTGTVDRALGVKLSFLLPEDALAANLGERPPR